MIMPLKNQIPRQVATVGVFYSRWGQVGLRPGAVYSLPPIWLEHLYSVSVLVSVIPPDSSDGIVLFGNF
jgi:hypothetical protein